MRLLERGPPAGGAVTVAAVSSALPLPAPSLPPAEALRGAVEVALPGYSAVRTARSGYWDLPNHAHARI